MKKTLGFIAVVALSGLITVSCSSLNKMKKRAGEITYSVTPETLVAKGGMVDLKIDVTFPAKYFNKKVAIEATPVLRFKGGEKAYEMKAIQGEKVQGNAEVIPYETGKTVSYMSRIPYEDAMRLSDLEIDITGAKGAKTVKFDPRKIGDGVIATETLVVNAPATSVGEDKFQRIIKQQEEAAIYYLINSANIRSKEMTSEEMKKLEAYIKEAAAKENMNLNGIDVRSYASPDGGVSLNTTLAENRESNTTKMLSKDLKKAKIDAPIDAKYTAQDWEGFQELVSKSNIQDKELILRVLSMYQDPAQREQEIKNISSVYKTLADEILPQLRRSRLTLNYEIIGKSDEEIAKLASSNPSELNVEELLYAATLTNDPAKQEAIYTQATKQFPNDYRAFNNLGKLAYQAGNVDKAESYFKKAASVNASPEVNMNLGLISLIKGDKAAAETYFGKAAGTKELGESMGNLYIAQGQYERAVNSFGDSKTNSAALAQILAKDYNKAKNTLANVERPDAYTDYLMAVLGARTNNSSMVTSSLKSAVAKDPSLAKKAATDLEFAKYFTNADFMSIAK